MAEMKIRLGLTKRAISGGPYRAKPKGVFGVKMAREIEADCNVDIPVEDYKVPVPADKDKVLEGVRVLIRKLSQGEQIYVGCMGGVGRTGLMLALVAKALGEKDPVGYVRANYNPHAVETEEQKAYVKKFDVRPLFGDVFVACLFAPGYDFLNLFNGKR